MWTMIQRDSQSLQIFINKCLRRILRVYWPSVISNAQIWSDTDKQPTEREIKSRKWGWIGYTLRSPYFLRWGGVNAPNHTITEVVTIPLVWGPHPLKLPLFVGLLLPTSELPWYYFATVSENLSNCPSYFSHPSRIF